MLVGPVIHRMSGVWPLLVGQVVDRSSRMEAQTAAPDILSTEMDLDASESRVGVYPQPTAQVGAGDADRQRMFAVPAGLPPTEELIPDRLLDGSWATDELVQVLADIDQWQQDNPDENGVVSRMFYWKCTTVLMRQKLAQFEKLREILKVQTSEYGSGRGKHPKTSTLPVLGPRVEIDSSQASIALMRQDFERDLAAWQGRIVSANEAELRAESKLFAQGAHQFAKYVLIDQQKPIGYINELGPRRGVVRQISPEQRQAVEGICHFIWKFKLLLSYTTSSIPTMPTLPPR